MSTIYEIKEREIADTPVLLFECTLTDGSVERWSTHRVTWDSQEYSARIQKHNLFEFRHGADEAIDGAARISVDVANADSHVSQLERSQGFKGSRLTVRFAFFDLANGEATSESKIVFRGTCTGTEELRESSARIGFQNLLNLQRVVFPSMRIQRRCSWQFPATSEQRLEGLNGGGEGKYSRWFACGYSPDATGGPGNLDGAAPFTSCEFTREDCVERGMFDTDGSGHVTRRFSGIDFVPSGILVRPHGEKDWQFNNAIPNEAKYNEAVPLVYGTGWFTPPVVFARNDGNLTRMQVLLGSGEIQGVSTVVVNGVEIPVAESGRDMTATGWYSVIATGTRTGAFDGNFTDGAGAPLGDPYGGLAYLSVVVPNQLVTNGRLPRVEVLVRGLKLPRFDAEGTYLGEFLTSNPAWIVLDILRRSGWSVNDVDLAAFGRAAAVCDELVEVSDGAGGTRMLPRFRCNLIVRKRKSVAELLRGIRTSAGLYLGYNNEGKVDLRVEGSLAEQHSTKPSGSNAASALNGGWPAYEFGDGTHGFSGIARNGDESPSIRFWSRPVSETPNRFSVEFQDEFNVYQQDSLSLVDVEDATQLGHELATSLPALGLPNAFQAHQILKRHLHRSLRGNIFVEFATSVRGLGIEPGDIITVTYLKDGFDRVPFRVLRVSPDLNFRQIRVSAQIHDDSWYAVSENRPATVGRQPGGSTTLPRPLVGTLAQADGSSRFGISESSVGLADGSALIRISAAFLEPAKPAVSATRIPALDVSAEAIEGPGTLAGGRIYYYAVTGVDAAGTESLPSFAAKADFRSAGAGKAVLSGLSFGPGAVSFHVYRGTDPQRMMRVASSVALASGFEDDGLAALGYVPPDANFDHANFYWRTELLPPVSATAASGTTVGSSILSMIADEFKGKSVRIVSGAGNGQEREILSNGATTLTVRDAWAVAPATGSEFVIVEPTWNFGSSSRRSPAIFEVPNRADLAIHISGRSANASDEESAADSATVTRWVIGGATSGGVDSGVPVAPTFSIGAAGKGELELVGVAFSDLTNTRTVESGTLTIFYWNELQGDSSHQLGATMDDSQTTLTLAAAGPGSVGDVIQVGSELLKITTVAGGGSSYTVTRGAFDTTASGHTNGAAVLHLAKKTFVVGFPREFFGSPASGSFSYRIYLPDARIVGAEMFVTNELGYSPTRRINYTGMTDGGIRTLSGGQLTLQVESYLAIQNNATPPLPVHESHAVRDIFARVSEAPIGEPVQLRLKVDGSTYCNLTIAAGSTVSDVVPGRSVAPLIAQSVLTLDIVSLGQTFETMPGRNLTVVVRL